MTNHQAHRRPPNSLIWQIASHAAVVLAVAGCGWLWLRSADGPVWQALLLTVLFPSSAVLGAVWVSRSRKARRWNAALDAFAAQEIDRTRREVARK
jgi:hypothetical protein